MWAAVGGEGKSGILCRKGNVMLKSSARHIPGLWLLVCFVAVGSGNAADRFGGWDRDTIEPGSFASLEEDLWRSRLPENESDYVVNVSPDGATYYARDGHDGAILTSGPEPGQVIQSAIDNLDPMTGGRVFIKAGYYELEQRITLNARNYIELVGTRGTFLSGPRLSTVVLIDGNSTQITIRGLSFIDSGFEAEWGGTAINCIAGNQVRIQDCDFDGLRSSAVQGHIGSDENPMEGIWVEGCRIRRANQDSLQGGAQGGLYFYCVEGLFIRGNLVEECGNLGVSAHRCSDQVIITDNVVRNNDTERVNGQGHGIYVSALEGEGRVTIRGNIITGNGGHGIEVASGDQESPGARYVITENICDSNGSDLNPHYRGGIYVTGSHHVVSNNICTRNSANGIMVGYSHMAKEIVVSNNVVSDNNVGMDPRPHYGSGITCMPSTLGSDVDSQGILIRGNMITRDPLDTLGQHHGIYLHTVSDSLYAGGSWGFQVEGNFVRGHPNPQIKWDRRAREMVLRNNGGFRTECRGMVVDDAGGFSGEIEVDLASHLDVDDVLGDLDPLRFSVSATPGNLFSYFNHSVEHLGGSRFKILWASGADQPEVTFSYAYGNGG